jgi:short-subunit dehydrogenase
MSDLQAHGIETLPLDVLSDESIAACVKSIDSLDILLNNAGAGYGMPFSDLSIPEAKKIFDLNVWSYLSVGQAFLPLLLKSKGMLVNHSSAAAVMHLPLQSTYNASKAAIAMFTNTMRLELEPLGVKVIDLKSGGVQSNFAANVSRTKLPPDSLYMPAQKMVEDSIAGEWFAHGGIPSDQWARQIVGDLSKKSPAPVICRGGQAWAAQVVPVLPLKLVDHLLNQTTYMDKAGQLLRRVG